MITKTNFAPSMTKIFIYEDNKDRREALSLLIETQLEMELIGNRTDCSTVAQDMKKFMPDLVLMDLQMPNINGVEGLRIIKSMYPHIKVLIQTVSEDPELILECIRYGAEGYILKKESPAKILTAIQDVMQGGANLTPSVAIEILRSISSQSKNSKLSLLSERETQVLELLADGKSYKMIAEELKITFATVNTHLRKVYEKLHVHSATEAIRVYYNS